MHTLIITEESDSPGRLDLVRNRAGELFEELDGVEISSVSHAVEFAERHGLVRIARAATTAGNGWLYPLATLLLVQSGAIQSPWRFIAASLLSVILTFSVYPLLKALLGRARPSDYDPSLARIPEPLDHYSCPSGHAMMASAFGVSLAFAAPALIPIAIGIWATISWSRVALGHHYPSDVAAGTSLGILVALLVGSICF